MMGKLCQTCGGSCLPCFPHKFQVFVWVIHGSTPFLSERLRQGIHFCFSLQAFLAVYWSDMENKTRVTPKDFFLWAGAGGAPLPRGPPFFWPLFFFFLPFFFGPPFGF